MALGGVPEDLELLVVGSIALDKRDGPFGDYSQAPAAEKPNPANVISVEGPSR